MIEKEVPDGSSKSTNLLLMHDGAGARKQFACLSIKTRSEIPTGKVFVVLYLMSDLH